MKTILKSVARITACVAMLGFGGLMLTQHSLIYHPSTYGNTLAVRMGGNAVAIDYSTAAGRQTAFYIPPLLKQPPERVWAMFNGNGALALDWTDFIARCPNKRDGFLLIEYPGYGQCEGSASPEAIATSAESALDQLAIHLRIERADLEKKLNVIGHSLGAAVGLAFAARHPVERVLLAAPFTSLRDMAQQTVGWPLCYALLQNFDNRARLAELAAREHPPVVSLFHGTEDSLIPIRMSRELVRLFPKMIRCHEIAGAGHNTIIDEADREMFAAMGND